MGWASYKFQRVKKETNVILGDIILIVPDMYNVVNLPKDGRYLLTNDLIVYPEFPFECSVMAAGEIYVNRLKEYGFANAINVTPYAQNGEKWVLGNGNYIDFNYYDPNSVGVIYRKSDGTSIDSKTVLVNDARTFFQFIFPRGTYVNNECENRPIIYLLSEESGGVKPNTISFYSPPTFPQQMVEPIFYTDESPIVASDPYEDGGTTSEGGGTGNFDSTGDNIAIPPVPTLSAVNAGFITLFNPTLSQMSSLASYMWSDLFDVAGWKKIFADPMGAILGLSIVPVDIPSGGTREVTVGNIPTGVFMSSVASQYVTVDCGTLNVNEFWGSYLDYDPYTKAEIYLPYIGTHAIATDDIMGKSVHITYRVDILSGACCAYIQCNGTVLYSFLGQCSSSIPITGNNWTNVINGALSIAGSIGSMVATGGASAPMAIGQIASTAVNAMKPSIEKSGSLSGTGGMLGVQTPYLILTRPRQALPSRQNSFIGYPSFITTRLDSLKGYTEIDSIHLENIPATEQELGEIENLLKGGVIL